jgi:hypothetical protein
MWKSLKIDLILCALCLLIGLSCSKDNSPVGPNVDPIITESSDLFIGYESSYYYANTDSGQFIASIGYYTNMDSITKVLPIIGLAVYDDNIEIFGIYFGSFYDKIGTDYSPDMERESGTISPYDGIWEWVGIPYTDIDTVQFSIYALPFAIHGDVSIDEAKKRVEKYFDNVVRSSKALGKRRTIKESIF